MQPEAFVPQEFQWVLDLLQRYGYIITLWATTSENVFILGIVTPGEVFVPIAGLAAAFDVLDLRLLYVIGVFGEMLGNNISYVIGRKGGRPIVDKYGKRFRIDTQRIERAENFVKRHGPAAVTIGRFVPGVKNFIPTLAGAAKMGFLRFQLFSLLGAVPYVALLLAAGYFFGESLEVILEVYGYVGWGAGITLVVIGVVAFGIWNWRRHRTQDD
jgi:membrane protein DedA with SNARE-associated domain